MARMSIGFRDQSRSPLRSEGRRDEHAGGRGVHRRIQAFSLRQRTDLYLDAVHRVLLPVVERSLLSSGNARISTSPRSACLAPMGAGRCFHPATHGSLPCLGTAQRRHSRQPSLLSSGNARISTRFFPEPPTSRSYVVAFIRQRTDLYSAQPRFVQRRSVESLLSSGNARISTRVRDRRANG